MAIAGHAEQLLLSEAIIREVAGFLLIRFINVFDVLSRKAVLPDGTNHGPDSSNGATRGLGSFYLVLFEVHGTVLRGI